MKTLTQFIYEENEENQFDLKSVLGNISGEVDGFSMSGNNLLYYLDKGASNEATSLKKVSDLLQKSQTYNDNKGNLYIKPLTTKNGVLVYVSTKKDVENAIQTYMAGQKQKADYENTEKQNSKYNQNLNDYSTQY